MKDLEQNSNISWGHGFTYEDLVASFEYEVSLMQSIGDYQGDYFVLLENNGEYGYLVFGYGSCSGCDALQSLQTVEEVRAYRDGLAESIRWFPGKQELAAFLHHHDAEGSWYGHKDDWSRFKAKALDVLGLGSDFDRHVDQLSKLGAHG